MGILLVGALILILIGMILFLFFWQTRVQSSSWLKQDIEALRSDFKESLNHLISQVNEQLRDNTSMLGERLDNTVKVVGTVSEHLGRLYEASSRIFEIGRNISSLQELLTAPKIRGGIGEFLLENLLSQIMRKKELYQMQYAFKNGQVVDAVIKVGHNLVPIDSKFPLENFKAMLACQKEEEKKAARRQFIADVKKHISDIASKYIIPDEGTFDFALMYIPAENVYYETIIKDEKSLEDGGLFQYSLSKKIIPVSPNTFYAYLQVILLGLKGMAIEKSAQEVLGYINRLKSDFDRFYEEFAKLGKHLGNANGSFQDAEKRLLKLQEKILQLGAGLQEERKLPYDEKISV